MDKIFKIGILVLGFGYLAYLFGVGANIDTADAHGTNQTGRYSFTMNTSGIGVLDTTNGDLYLATGKGQDFMNLVKAGNKKRNKPYKP